jgi:hypothetical protein
MQHFGFTMEMETSASGLSDGILVATGIAL